MTLTKQYLPKDYDIFIGLDVDKNKFVLKIKDHGAINVSKTMPAEPKVFHNYINKHYSDKRIICAYEAGPTGFGLYDELTKNNVPCLVVSPMSIPKAKSETTKTNKIDAAKIAEYLHCGKLRSIKVPTGIYRELRHLVRIRELYTEKRKKAKQRIKAVLLQESLYAENKDVNSAWTREYVEKIKNIKTSEAVKYRLEMLIMDLEYSKRQLLSIQGQVKKFCKIHSENNQHITLLRTIPWIGFIVSTTILGKIGDPKRLGKEREIAGFLGLTPWENSTGEEENKGSITHFGNQKLRALLVESAWAAIRKDTRLKQFYYRIKSRKHLKIGSVKAIVAVARKVTQIIYRILKDQREYVRE